MQYFEELLDFGYSLLQLKKHPDMHYYHTHTHICTRTHTHIHTKTQMLKALTII